MYSTNMLYLFWTWELKYRMNKQDQKQIICAKLN